MNRIELQQRRRLLRLESGLRERVEAEALALSLGQTARLASLRGEAVEVEPGRLRIWSRDGLRTLYEGDDLDASEYEAGLFYRTCLETVGKLPTSALSDAATSGGVSGAAVTEWRAWRALNLGVMDALARSEPEATALLRIAGEGRALRSISQGGRDFRVNLRALKAVLGRIADRFGL
jgi:hypothetical protein